VVTVAPDVASIVRPLTEIVDAVVVRERDPRLDGPLAAAADALRTGADRPDVVAAVRAMYRRVGIDPTRTRPSSESLLRRVRRGEGLPRVNALVDVINWCSAESGLPFGLYDAARIQGDVTLRLGRGGEEYPGIRKDAVHVSGRLVLADAIGPFGNPTSDSARTMITTVTTRALVVIFAPVPVPADAARALQVTLERIREYCVPVSG
jgi:DNA/RNA-binding domain of Phe-tRNA-synthetase-like protein